MSSQEMSRQAPPPREIIRPSGGLMAAVKEASGVEASLCWGCRKCSNGCPLTFAMDLHPYQVVRYLQLGLVEPLLSCRTIWVCASCQTCLTRCPNQVDLPRLMDHLKETLFRERAPVPEKRTLLFHRLFLREIKARGRVFEPSLMGRYQLAAHGPWGPQAKKNLRLAWAMLRRGRLKLLPSRTRARAWRRRLFKESRL